jgi:hypothetical protein
MNPDDVDKQIAAAYRTQGDVDAASVARLEAFWRRQTRQRRARRRVLGLAMAASVLVALVTWMIMSSKPVDAPSEFPAPAPQIIAASDPPEAATGNVDLVGSDQDSRPASPRSAGRLPSAYERLVFVAHSKQRAGTPQWALAARVDAAIERLAYDPGASVEFPTDASGGAMSGAERRLLARLRRATSEELDAIVQLLARYGTTRSLPALIQLAAQPRYVDSALAAIERLAPGASLAVAVRQSRNALVRQRLLMFLLADAAASRTAALSFLSLAADPVTREDALVAARDSDSLPVGSFVLLLEHDDQAVRIAAASVLGAVGGPAVSDALIGRLSRPQRAPTEAWVALLACRGPRVEQFLARATVEPRLIGQVNNARALWARFVP